MHRIGESLYCTPETATTLYSNYTSIFKKRKRKMIHFKLTGLFLCVGGKGQNDLACVSLGMDNLKTTKDTV